MTISATKKIILGLGILACSTLAYAQGKIAVLDLQAAMLNTEVAQKRLEELEKNEDYAALRTKYQSLASEIQALQEDAQKNAMTWSEEQRTAKQQEMQKLRQEYEGTLQTLQGGRQRIMQAMMQQMGPQTRTVLDQLIEAQKIDLVIDSQSVYHAADSYDITEKVTELLNKAP